MTGVWKGLIVVSVFVLLAVVGAACSSPATTDQTEGTVVEPATGSLDAEADGDEETGSGSDSGDPESGDMDPSRDDDLDSGDSAPGRDDDSNGGDMDSGQDDDSVGAGDTDAGDDDDSKSGGEAAARTMTLDGGEKTAAVEPDPDYEAALASARFRTAGWKTDFSRHTVPYSEILSGGVPRDGIPPLDDPRFVTQDEADEYVEDQEPVIVFEGNGEAKAYPLQILTWHEIVNDEVGGIPVSVTYCPLCNSAVAFDRRLDGVVYDFGTSGNLRNSDLIMWDRQTESWWQQLTGEAIVGELAGKVLTFLPAALVSYGDFKLANPEGLVLSRETGHPRDYGSNPYTGYDKPDSTPFLYDGALDDRLPPKERVVTVTVGDADVAFPYSVLATEGAVNYELNGQQIAVFHAPGTTSALDGRSISESRDVGGTGVFKPSAGGRTLTFRVEDGKIVDEETGSTWTVLGRAVEGPMAGEQLRPVVHGDHFWFAWAAFKPGTQVYGGA